MERGWLLNLKVGPRNTYSGMVANPSFSGNGPGIFNVPTEGGKICHFVVSFERPLHGNCMELTSSTQRGGGFVAPEPANLRNSVTARLRSHPVLTNNKNNQVYDHQVDADKNPLTFHHYHNWGLKVQTSVG